MRKAYSLVTLLLLAGGTQIFSATECKPVREGYKFKFDIESYQIENVKVENRNFQRVQAGTLTPTGEIGAPELFESYLELALNSENISIQIDSVKEEFVTLDAPLYPRQKPVAYSFEAQTDGFAFDSNAYKRNYSTDYVKVDQVYKFRHQDAASLHISPLRYDAAHNTLTVAKEIEFTVYCDKPTHVRTANSMEFDSIIREKFINLSNDAGRSLPSDGYAKSKYLIITRPEYKDNADLKALIEYRKEKYEVEVVSTSEANTKSKDEFRKFIRGKMPTYLLLVGTYQDFPTHAQSYGGTQVKCYNYHVSSNTSGRLKPDISLGLFLVKNASDIKNIVKKTLHVEKNIASYPKHIVGQGGNTKQMGQMPPDHADKMVQECFDKYFKNGGFKFSHIKSKDQGAKRDVELCNEGVSFINYNGHGLETKWQFGWGNSDLSKLKNTVYPLVLSCACLTGTFDKDCMGASFVKHEAGPAAFLGAYNTSNMGQHVLNMALFDAMANKKYTFGMAFTFAQNADEKAYQAKSLNGASADNSTMSLMIAQYHIFGDPAIVTSPGNL